MNNRRKKALVQIGILFMAGLGLAASGRASTESGVEAVAVIEVTSGFTTTYNVGLSFANNSDCTARALQLNTMLNNLLAQGCRWVANRLESPVSKATLSSFLTLISRAVFLLSCHFKARNGWRRHRQKPRPIENYAPPDGRLHLPPRQ